ncbi:VOC family protein [Microlunatus soli]|uniref:Uncharacterized conserved protein PhnB, glyoxalase superfamily n=1 Tax=Microlunatus soli TaxID=630515 RepID=A0A1H1S687_9ACTN|nr:hypothetical protein [Microlunatus soli]SDS43504.1 Uncharacterized conserved protein PhnB, glyoxalase superfamily [Microlunatus soli]
MVNSGSVLPRTAFNGRGSSLNPFVVIEDAAGFIDFAVAVFSAREVTAARTATPTGTLIHAELEFGDSLLMLSDPQRGWVTRPGLFQLWVSDVSAILDAAADHGTTVVTPPTPFYGEVTLARMRDRWDNLWWLYQPSPGQPDPVPAWDGGSDVVFRTIDEYMQERAR